MDGKKALLLFGLFLAVESQMDPTENYTHYAKLGSPKKHLMKSYWKFTDTHITFEVHSRTTGWVGIGFSDGGMNNADMVMGWVANGEVTVVDAYSEQAGIPSVDSDQNIQLLGGTECDGWTMLKFSRKLSACDAHDREITENTMKLIWASGQADPSNETLARSDYHQDFRGSMSIYLLESADKPSDLKSGPIYKTFDILADDFLIPSEKTYYNCRLYKLPDLGKKHHIVKFEPIIQEGNERIVHHILIYRCGDNPKNQSFINVDGKCYSEMGHFETCATVIVSWAIGGGYTVYPEEAGLSIGGEGDPVYIQMETHYDNPFEESGKRDSSGLRFTYTDSLRKHDIGVLYVGNAVIPTQHFIPPKAENFLNVAFCYPQCLQKGMGLEDKELTVFSVLLHSHLAGRALRLRHFRDGIELPTIANDDSYDFNYQEARYVQPHVTVTANDTLRMECVYNTKDRKEMTEGGFGTSEEMCISFVMYYPRIETGTCASSISAYRTWPYFGIDLAQLRFKPGYEGLDSMYLAGPEEMKGKTVKDVMNEKIWNETTANELSAALLGMEQQSICVGLNQSETTMFEYPTPAIKSVYTPPPKENCTSPVSRDLQKREAILCGETGPGKEMETTTMVSTKRPDDTTSGSTRSVLLSLLHVLSPLIVSCGISGY